MQRWYTRLSEPVTDDERRLDDFYAFSVCCYHLKDWLKADSCLDSKITGQVEFYVATNLWLCLCSDLANASKHAQIDRGPRFDSQARVAKDTSQDRIVVTLDGQKWFASDVAKKFVAAWDTFLNLRGLLPGRL
jgi:hypothetical protein